MVKIYWTKFLFIGLLLFSKNSRANEKDYLKELLDQSSELKLSETRQWKKLLFYDDRLFHSEKSLIDDKNFFISPEGNRNPQKELEKTIESFLKPDTYKHKPSSLHPQCFFAARFDWLNSRLHFDSKKMTRIKCEGLERFKKLSQYNDVSVVFSNYFINNPASMFGHTFLRLHKSKSDESGLLDDAVSYAAHVENMNLITYPIKGLFGGFQGRFSLVSYYEKINEYSNSESRDLWEYKLNFTPEQSQKLALVLWELGNTYFNYYYLSENCSFILLTVLEAVDPSLHLSDEYFIFASPESTLKTIAKQPGLVKKISYRPSVLGRYLNSLRGLNKDQKLFLEKIFEEKQEIKFSKKCNSECQAKVLDTALNFIEYKKPSREDKGLIQLRRNLLILRSQNSAPVFKNDSPPKHLQPELGHNTSFLGLMGGSNNNNESWLEFRYLPGLHGLNSQDLGYSPDMAMRFFDLKLRHNTKRQSTSIYSLDVIDIISLPKNELLLPQWAWHISTGLESYNDCMTPEGCKSYYLRFGVGKSLHLLSSKLILFNILHANLGFSNEADQHTHIGPWNTLGLNIKFSESLKLTSSYDYSVLYSARKRERSRIKAILNYYPIKNLDLKLSFQNEKRYSEALIGLGFYY